MRIVKNINFLRIKIDGYPAQKTRHVISFITGTLLAISECMPFMDSKSNGILHALYKIEDEYKNNL